MPEVPEVQAHAERLDADFAGAVLEKFTPVTFTALKTYSPDPAAVAGQPLVFVGRRGKHLLLDFGTATFVVHLMQGGRLKPDEKQSAKPRGGIARWRFTDGRALLLTEAGTERKAGVWVVAGDPEGQPPLDELGPEAELIERGRCSTSCTPTPGASMASSATSDSRRPRPSAGQRDLPSGEALAVRQRRQARPRRRHDPRRGDPGVHR